MNRERQFAYGANCVDSCPCPAMAAGFNPDSGGETLSVAEKYDEIVRKSYSDEGTISEDEAHDAWLQAIDYWDRTAEQTPNARDRQWHRAKAEAGREVARELGWL